MRILWIFLLGLSISACTPRLIALPDPTKLPATPVATPGEESDRVLSIATADLATRLALDPARIRLLSAEAVIWPDTSLGCPRPGEVYAQQTIPGYRLRLGANGQDYIYHTDTDSAVILCSEEELPSFPGTPGEIDDGRPWMPVD